MNQEQEVMELAIQKALQNGWVAFGKQDHYYKCGKCGMESTWGDLDDKYHDDDGGKWHLKTKLTAPFPYEDHYLMGWGNRNMQYESLRLSAYDIIFNHDFAKALWGKDDDILADWCYLDNGDQMRWSAWKFHLMMMSIDNNPIEYLLKHIKEEP